MRREAEAAEATGLETTAKKSRKPADEKAEAGGKKAARGEKKDAPAKKKKDVAAKKKRVAKPRTRRAREQMQRRRVVWVVYSSTMREEGRFLFYEKDKAGEFLETLLARGKRKYFMQPLKETLNPDGTPIIQVVAPPPEDDVEEVRPDAEVEPAEDDLELEELEIEAEEGEEGVEAESGDDAEGTPVVDP